MTRPSLRAWAAVAVVLLLLAGLGGFLVATSGVIPLTASSGHWAVTEWILQFGKRRSVSTHTLTMQELRFDEPWLVMKGAGHYESGCRPCHGSPGVPTPRIAAAMLPLPPYLSTRVAEWSPEELFYIVKHGIKFTGMPAWQTQQRDDEVRAMVAFLLEMPNLDEESYERLVYGPAPAEPAVVTLEEMAEPEQPPGPVTSSCARCHGMDGLGRGNAAFPKLAGQRPDYLYAALRAYAAGDRHSGIMAPVAAGLSEQEWRVLADYYAGLGEGSGLGDGLDGAPGQGPAGAAAGAVDLAGQEGGVPSSGASIERGRLIADRGMPELGVPSCADCHGPTEHVRNPTYPSLAGQYADYLALQLDLFKQRRRGGSPYAPIMHHVVGRLEQQHIRDVAAYYASLEPSDGSGPSDRGAPER